MITRTTLIGALVTMVATMTAIGQEYAPVLLPLAFEGAHHGLLGATWETELVLRNNGDRAVRYLPNVCGQVECPILKLEPHTTVSQPLIAYKPPTSAAPPGRFILLEEPGASNVTIMLHLRETTIRNGWGTQLPTIRATDAFTETVELLNIPTDVALRQTLRVYDFTGRASAAYRVQLSDLDACEQACKASDSVLREVIVHTAGGVTDGPNPLVPGYAQLDRLTDVFPELRTAVRLRVTIEPLDGGRFWAFASVTDNTTNHVTLFTP